LNDNVLLAQQAAIPGRPLLSHPTLI
jgi:hypothetical protein